METNETNQICESSRCPLLNRRSFLMTTAGALAVASAECMGANLLEFTSELLDSEGIGPVPIKQGRIRVAFARPNDEKYWMGWPGAAYDIKAHRKLYTKVLTTAAGKLGVKLEIIPEPLYHDPTMNIFLGNLKKDSPDGVLVIMMGSRWDELVKIAPKLGEIPMVVFGPMGTYFTTQLWGDIPGVYVGGTQDVGWLAMALRMLNTVHLMKNTRLCIARGSGTKDRKLPVIGTTLHYIANNRFAQEYKKVEMSDEIRAIADYYTRHAKKIVEPSKQDILDAVKNYVVCRRLMAAEKCHGFSMDCLRPVTGRQIQPPCLAFSRLRDEGIVGACEADWNAAISSRLTHLLFERPGFMQDPCPNTVNNTLMGAHCTCATKLDGFDKPAAPFILRSHSESDLGVAPQVLWQLGQRVTVMKFTGPEDVIPVVVGGPNTIILGTGTVVSNIDTPPSGGCRTSVEIELDDVPDARKTRGFHQLFIYGDLENEFKAYCQLAKIRVEHI